MQTYWSCVAPPIDVVVAAYVGWKPEVRVKADNRKGDLGELIAMFAGTGGMIN
jgi:hypothetical protein